MESDKKIEPSRRHGHRTTLNKVVETIFLSAVWLAMVGLLNYRQYVFVLSRSAQISLYI